MKKLTRPDKLDIDPNLPAATIEWKQWLETFDSFIANVKDVTEKLSALNRYPGLPRLEPNFSRMRCSFPDSYFDPPGPPLDKEHELALAVVDRDFRKVHSLLQEGVSKNGLYKGRTLLALAAAAGDINTMQVLLETASLHKQPKAQSSAPRNTGYFVVVRQGSDDDEETAAASDKRRRTRTKSEEVTTPEGMGDLEWDTELEDLTPPLEKEEDIWSNQYRWYAKILADTSQVWADPLGIDEMIYSTEDTYRVESQDPRGRYALHYAAEAGQLEAVEFLIQYVSPLSGSKVDVVDRESMTPLHLAAMRGHVDTVKCLLDHRANPNAKCTDKMSPLHYAASRGHVDVVTTLIERGSNIDSLDSCDRTPLKLAASRDLYQVVKIFVKSGAKVNIEDVKGYTALSEAVWQKNVAMASLLLEVGAKLTPTPFLLHYAILHRHYEMVELLLKAGAMVNIRDDHGSTPLIVAAVTAQPPIIRLLLRYGAQVDFCGGLSWKTPLISVLQSNHIPTDLGVILELIFGGADVDKACWDTTPLVAALCHRKTDAASLLLRHGASINPRHGAKFHDPMIFARRIGALSAVQAIVLCGYDLWKNCPEITKCLPDDKPDPNNVNGWLQAQKFTPLRLGELARIKVRSLWPRNSSMASYVRSLELPPVLMEYLLLSDIPTESSSLLQGSAGNRNFSVFWGFAD